MHADPTRDLTTELHERLIAPGGRRYGLVIGIEKYADARLNLRCARADARAVYDLMVDPKCGLFPAANVQLLLDAQATTDAIWKGLARLRKQAGENDAVWIYYAGHAAAQDDSVYWVTHDADVDDLYATALHRERIDRVLEEIRSTRVLLLLDCCHAAATATQKNPTRAVLTAEELFGRFEGHGRITLASSDGKQKSVELSEFGHGAFTYYLTKGLRGEADAGGDGVVTADELWVYLRGKVEEASRKAGNVQTPVFQGAMTHDVALTLNAAVTSKKQRLATYVESLVGLRADRLTTDEARFCLDVLGRVAHGHEEATLLNALESAASGQLEPRFLKALARAAMLTAGEPPEEQGLAAEEKAREERERIAAEKKAREEKQEQERLAAEQFAAAKTAREQQERLAAEEATRRLRHEKERQRETDKEEEVRRRRAEQASADAKAIEQAEEQQQRREAEARARDAATFSALREARKPRAQARGDLGAGHAGAEPKSTPTSSSSADDPLADTKPRKITRWIPFGVAGITLVIAMLVAVLEGTCSPPDQPPQNHTAAGRGDTGDIEPALPTAVIPPPLPPPVGSCPEGMALIPAGTFKMGSPPGEGESDEHPQRDVKLSAFCMDKTEVTVAQYHACAGEARGGVRCDPAPTTVAVLMFTTEQVKGTSKLCNANRAAHDTHPINCIDWRQASTYCTWIGGRLPTEAEWEYAARGSEGRTYPWGKAPPDETHLNACGGECIKVHPGSKTMYPGDDHWAETAPVGTYPTGATPQGLLDMAANVWEWTGDYYAIYEPSSGVLENPVGPSKSSPEEDSRVIRGGSWYTGEPSLVRSAYRGRFTASVRDIALGFRCSHAPQ